VDLDLEFDVGSEFPAELEWADAFVAEEVEPLDLLINHVFDFEDPLGQELTPPLQDKVRALGLWAPSGWSGGRWT